MAKFLVTYFGGGMPSNPAEAAAAVEAFGQWLGRAGRAVVDPGAPLKPGSQVAKGTAAPKVTIGGYSVIEADDLDAALEVLKSHPFVARGGTLQVDEALALT
ncbi:MAG TPA: YciI family protein [Candidatus Dormibacteraeota bacterium]